MANVVNQVISRINLIDGHQIAQQMPQLIFQEMVRLAKIWQESYESDLYHDAMRLHEEITNELCAEHAGAFGDTYAIKWAIRKCGTEWLNLCNSQDRSWWNANARSREKENDWHEFTMQIFKTDKLRDTYTCEIVSCNEALPDWPSLESVWPNVKQIAESRLA